MQTIYSSSLRLATAKSRVNPKSMQNNSASLTPQNFKKGFLVDEELMAGVTENPDGSGTYAAFVLRPESGEYLGYQICPTLDEALALIQRIPRNWTFESTAGCDGSRCEEGKCKGEGCKIYDPAAAELRLSGCSQ
jgi:hypothetical protein